MKMCTHDLSYLYCDDYFISSSMNEKELPKKLTNTNEYRLDRNRSYRKRATTLPNNRRSKHILLYNDELVKRQTNRLLARQLLEENIQKRIQQLQDKHVVLENNLKQYQLYKKDLKTRIIDTFSMNSLTQLLSTDEEKMSLSFDENSNDYQVFDIPVTSTLNSDNDINRNIHI